MRIAPALKRWGPLALVVLLALLAVQQGWLDYLTLDAIARNRERLEEEVAGNYPLALLAYTAAYVLVIALSIPGGALMTMLGGFLFGWLVGGIAALVAATAGATIVFLVARSSFGGLLAGRAGALLDRLREGFSRDAFNYLLFLRLVPAFPFWLINIAPALLGVRLATYALATFIGIIPGTFAFAFLGAGLDSVIAAQAESAEACRARPGEGAAPSGECELHIDPGSLLTTELIVAFVALGLVALVPVALRRLGWTGRSRRRSS